jgi:IS605 OrfB family transposase
MPSRPKLVTRTYAAALHPADAGALWTHHHAANIAVAAAVDALLSVAASSSIQDLPTVNPPARRRQRILLACSWLSVEATPSVSARYVVTSRSERPDDPLVARLEQILVAQGESDVEGWLDDCRVALRSPVRTGAAWVDRRAMWDAGELALPGWRPLAAVVAGPGDDSPNLSTIARGWWSTGLGQGRPANWRLLECLASRLAACLEASHVPARLDQLAVAVLGPGSDAQALAGAFRAGVPGRPSQLAALLGALGPGPLLPEDLLRLRSAASRYLATCRRHLEARSTRLDAERAGERTAAEALRDRMVAASGIAYRLDPYCELLGQALSIVVARRAKLRSRVDEWLDAESSSLASESTIDPEARRALDLYCADRTASTGSASPYRLSGRATRRLPRLLEAWQGIDDTPGRLRALDDLAAGDLDLGDHHLYAWLAAQSRSVLETVIAYRRWHARLARLERLKAPCLTAPHPLRAPRFSWFGAEKWRCRLSPMGELELTVWDGSDYRSVDARWSSARVTRQLVAGHGEGDGGGVVVSRDDRRSRAAAGAGGGEVSVPVSFTTAAVQLRFDRSTINSEDPPPPERLSWSVAIAFRLRPAPPRGPASGTPGYRLLGVDLGIRRDASLAVVEVVDDAEVGRLASALGCARPAPDAPAWRVRESGSTATRTYRRIASADAPSPHWARLDALDVVDLSGPGAWASDGQRRDLAAIARLLDGARLAPELAARVAGPKVRRSAVLEVAFAMLGEALDAQSWLARATADGGAPATPALDAGALAPGWPLPADLAQRHDPSAAARRVWDERDVAVGRAIGLARDLVFPGGSQGIGVSLARVSELDRLHRLQRRHHARPRPGGRLFEPAEGGFGAQLARKRLAVRRQWSTQVGGAIVDAALRHGCHAVVLEDLSRFRPAEARARRDNRRLRLWAHRSLAATVASLCELHGLALASVNPAGTSRIDARTGAPGARWQRAPLGDAARIRASAWWGRLVAEAHRGGLGEHRRRHVLDVDARLAQATHGPALRRVSIDVPDPAGELLAPEDAQLRDAGDGGWLVVGATDADLSAAVNVAVRGARIRRRRHRPAVVSA